MHKTHHTRMAMITGVVLTAALLNWPAIALAQLPGVGGLLPGSSGSTSTVQGAATAAQATILGLGSILGQGSTTLADTGTLSAINDARDASQVTGRIGSLLTAETLHAVTFSYPHEVDSEASLGSLIMNVGGVVISADSVLAQASAVSGAAGSATSTISGLSVNGVPVYISGVPNQTVGIPGGQIIINEQSISPNSTTVNALHITATGLADVVIVSAKAAIP